MGHTKHKRSKASGGTHEWLKRSFQPMVQASNAWQEEQSADPKHDRNHALVRYTTPSSHRQSNQSRKPSRDPSQLPTSQSQATSYISELRPEHLTPSRPITQADDITRLQERIQDIEAYSLRSTGYDESRSPHLPNFYTTVDTLANLMKVAVNDAVYYDSLSIPNQERTTQLSQTDFDVFCLAANECSQQGFNAEAEWNVIAHGYRAFTNFRSPPQDQMTEDNLEKFMDMSATQGERLRRVQTSR